MLLRQLATCGTGDHKARRIFPKRDRSQFAVLRHLESLVLLAVLCTSALWFLLLHIALEVLLHWSSHDQLIQSQCSLVLLSCSNSYLPARVTFVVQQSDSAGDFSMTSPSMVFLDATWVYPQYLAGVHCKSSWSCRLMIPTHMLLKWSSLVYSIAVLVPASSHLVHCVITPIPGRD